ncbi:MAG: hypothetical protein LUE98_08900 [Tannerellaceae bacterium]|nr:hypothetical protein [Tannerellaceae bacterium]
MKQQERFEWRAGITCPNLYPIREHASVLIFDDGYTYLESGAFLRSNWKGPGSTNTTDNRDKKHPTAW